MDQLKSILAVAIKYGFWIGSVLISLASLTIWYMSTSTLAEETESESRRLKSKIAQISSVNNSLETVPNDQSHEVMRSMIEKRQNEVLLAWEKLFDRQMPYLTWPVEEVGAELVAKFKGKIPIEQYIPFPIAENELSPRLLKIYRDHIKSEPAKLAAIAGAVWTASDDKNSASGLNAIGTVGTAANNEVVQQVPVVAWSTQSQQDLKNDLFRWGSDTPNTLEIYYSQESQWIMRQLMTIIKEVNGDATQPYQAKIRSINEIKIGSSVRFDVGTITNIQGSSAGSLSSLSMGSGSGMPASGADGGSGLSGMGGLQRLGSGGGGLAQSSVDPAEGRYVDKNLVHISASSLRAALESNKPADASLAVAKRVPVMLGVTMDQRTVHELLAACGSADLMVEVTHVRVLGPSSGSSGGTSSSGSIGSGLESLGVGGQNRTVSTSSDIEEYPFDVKVEIRGMIYIYNPPDRNKLPVEQVTNETLDEALGEAPAVETPPAGTPDGSPLPQSNEELPPVTQPADRVDPELDTESGQPDAASPPPADTSTPPATVDAETVTP